MKRTLCILLSVLLWIGCVAPASAPVVSATELPQVQMDEVPFTTPSPTPVPTPTPSGPVSTPVPRIVDYGIPLGIDVIINHVGDCYE